MSEIITVDATTTLVLIDTAQYPYSRVQLPPLAQDIAQLTVRDNAGGSISADFFIRIRAEEGTSFAPSPILTNSTNIFIRQPFGFVTFSYNAALNLWSVLDSFGFQSTDIFLAQQVTVSTIQVIDSSIPNTINSIGVANGTLLLNGTPLTGGSVPNPFNASNINASTMTLSHNLVFTPSESNIRLNVSGTVQTNFLTLNDTISGVQQTISLSNYSLNRNGYPIAPIGGYIEFAYFADNIAADIPTVYPLAVSADRLYFLNGPWNPASAIFTSGQGYVSGLIALPGYNVTARDVDDTVFCEIDNSTNQPIYSNVNSTFTTVTNNYLAGYVEVKYKTE